MDPEKKDSGANPGTGAPQPIPTATLPGPAQPVPLAASAQQSVPKFGGNRGGKARTDGLAPGSPEALEADKKKDRERKQAARKTISVAEPPALPAAGQKGVYSVPPSPGSAVPGTSGPVAQAAPAPVPWQPETLKPLFDQLVATCEEGRIHKFEDLARKAGLPVQLAKEMGKDAKYSDAYVVAVTHSGPKAVAQVMNSLGVSGKYTDPGILVTAILANWVQTRQLTARIEKAAEQWREKMEQQAAANPPNKPPAGKVATAAPAL